MADKGVVAALIGIGAGLLLAAAYFGAPYAGYHFDITMMTLAAAVTAFCASVGLLVFVALPKPKKKKIDEIRIRDLPPDAFARFPTDGPRPVIRPDMLPKDIGVVRDSGGGKYADKNIFVTIKKGKGIFNPNVLKQIFAGLKGYQNFIHVLLVNEHDEYVGYLPALYARSFMTGDNAETLIGRYITDVFDNPNARTLREIDSVLRDGVLLKKCIALTCDDCISADRTVTEAMEKVTADHLRGLVVYHGHRNRKAIGVIWDEDLLRLVLKSRKQD
jgi:hypothetical protein